MQDAQLDSTHFHQSILATLTATPCALLRLAPRAGLDQKGGRLGSVAGHEVYNHGNRGHTLLEVVGSCAWKVPHPCVGVEKRNHQSKQVLLHIVLLTRRDAHGKSRGQIEPGPTKTGDEIARRMTVAHIGVAPNTEAHISVNPCQHRTRRISLLFVMCFDVLKETRTWKKRSRTSRSVENGTHRGKGHQNHASSSHPFPIPSTQRTNREKYTSL